MKYMYDSHLGPIYFTDHLVPVEQRYCRTCNDCDMLICEFTTFKECWEHLQPECSINGRGGYSLQYVLPTLNREFNWNENIPYADHRDEVEGFCCLSDSEILNIINKHLCD